MFSVIVELQSTSSQDEDCTSWKWDNSKTKLWNEDTQRKHGSGSSQMKYMPNFMFIIVYKMRK